jgi:hypothetical protein
VQRLDMWTLGRVLLECAKAVEEASPRGFPVVPTAGTTMHTEGGGHADGIAT